MPGYVTMTGSWVQPLPPYEGDEPFVFICYARAESDVVYPEIRCLQDQGVNVWYDEGIAPGSEWSDELAQHIQRCSRFLYFISPASVASEHCRRELNFAQQEERRVLGVELEPTELRPGLQLALNNRQIIVKHQLSAEEHQRRLLAALEGPGATVGRASDPPSIDVSRTGSQGPRFAAAVFIVALLVWAGFSYFGPPTDVTIGSADATVGAIAVLPLQNLSGDPAQEYVADGMTAELISELGRLDGLTVISQTSVMQYKMARPSVREIADALGVNWILEGGVAREADTMRVNVNLIDARSDAQVWSGRFDRQGSSVLALRSDVSSSVASELQLQLSNNEQQPSTAPHVVNEEAYDAYLRGLAVRANSRAAVAEMIAAFETAVELDPNFAEAHARLAGILVFTGLYDPAAARRARAEAERAISLNPGLALPHAVLAQIAVILEWDADESRRHIDRALELNSSDRMVLVIAGFIMIFQQRYDEAISISDLAVRLDPINIDTRRERAVQFFLARRYERSVEEMDDLRAFIEPGYVRRGENQPLALLGRYEDAARTRIAELERCGSSCDEIREAAQRGWDHGGHEGRLRAELPYLAGNRAQTTELIAAYAWLGEMDQAFELLAPLAQTRLPVLGTLRVSPVLDRLRMDPRFDAMADSVGLPTVPNTPARMGDEGRVLAFMGRAPDALSRIERAMTESPDDERLPRWLEAMAWAHFAAGDYAASAAWARRVLERDVSRHAEAFAHLLLASSHAHRDQLDAAKAALGEALSSWPSNLDYERDLRPLFLGGDADMGDRYLHGLRIAGLEARTD